MLDMKKLYFGLILSAFLALTLASSASAEISANVDMQRYGVKNLSKNEAVYSQDLKAVTGDELEFSINIKNSSGNQANGVELYVYLPIGFPLDTNSIYVDGTRTGGNVAQGLFLGNINTNAQKDIVFKTKVNDYFGGYAAIQALVAGDNFTSDSKYVAVTKNGSASASTISDSNTSSGNSNSTNNNPATANQNNNLKVSLLGKNLTKKETTWQKAVKAEPGDEIEFSIMLSPTSSLWLRNVQVKNTLDSFLDFTSGSVTIDNLPTSNNLLNDRLYLGDLSPQDTKFIKFQARVQNASQFGKDPLVLSDSVQVWADNNIKITDSASVSAAVKQSQAAIGPAVSSSHKSNSGVKAPSISASSQTKFQLTAPKETAKTLQKKNFLFGTIAFGSFGLWLILILLALIILLLTFLVQEKKKNKNQTITA